MKRISKIILIALVCCLMQVSCKSEQSKAAAKDQQTTTLKSAAPKAAVFTLTDVKQPQENGVVGDFSWKENGKTVKFSDFTKGKYVFVNFWATWCPPCRAEIPDLIAVSKEYASKNLVVIGIANERSNNQDPAVTVSEFATKNGIPYHIMIANAEIQKAFGGIQFIPKSFIIDNTGKIVETIDGSKEKAEFEKILDKYIK